MRSTGSVNPLTRQPIKGRKFGGGIRFGEMERDSLLAHGAAYLVHDRLHNCSDYHVMDICAGCGSILSTLQFKATKQAQQTLHLSAVDNDGERSDVVHEQEDGNRRFCLAAKLCVHGKEVSSSTCPSPQGGRLPR